MVNLSPHACTLHKQSPNWDPAHTHTPRSSAACPRPHLVQVAVQAIVDDGVEVLQAAAVEGIDQVSFSFGLIKSGVGRVKVLDFKQEVRGGDRCSRGACQLLDLFELENTRGKQSHSFIRDTGKCALKVSSRWPACWHRPTHCSPFRS